jgi:hypothetical protein
VSKRKRRAEKHQKLNLARFFCIQKFDLSRAKNESILSKKKKNRKQEYRLIIKKRKQNNYLLFVAPVETPKDPVALPAFARERLSLTRVMLPP